MARILVCGGRDFDDASLLERTLNALPERPQIIIEGGARGADRLARMWADLRGVEVMTFFAQWQRDGKAAGPIRNRAMLVNGRPDLVVAFPGGRGTENMIAQSRKAGVPVQIISAEELR